MRVRDVPHLTGVSKAAVAMSTGFLAKRGDVVIEPDLTATRGKVVRRTPQGKETQLETRRLIGTVEARWQARFGSDVVSALHSSLERLSDDTAGQASRLFRGLEPYADGWWASVPTPATLPHDPTVLHRGGFPDGS